MNRLSTNLKSKKVPRQGLFVIGIVSFILICTFVFGWYVSYNGLGAGPVIEDAADLDWVISTHHSVIVRGLVLDDTLGGLAHLEPSIMVFEDCVITGESENLISSLSSVSQLWFKNCVFATEAWSDWVTRLPDLSDIMILDSTGLKVGVFEKLVDSGVEYVLISECNIPDMDK